MRSHPDHRFKTLPAHFVEPIRAVTEALQRLRFGVIQLTVHDGKMMQLDVTERRRFP